MNTTQFTINDYLTEDETLEKAYSIFLEQAADHLKPVDLITFSLQFEMHGAAKIIDLSNSWFEKLDFTPNQNYFSEVVIGLTCKKNEITNIFARMLICRVREHKFYHIC